MRYNLKKHIKTPLVVSLIFIIYTTICFYVPQDFIDEHSQTANAVPEKPVNEREEKETRERKNIRNHILLINNRNLMPLLCKTFLINSQLLKKTILFLRE